MTDRRDSATAAGAAPAHGRAMAVPSKCALMFHGIGEPLTKQEAAYSIAPRRFHSLMRWFRWAGYRTMTTAEWLVDTASANRTLFTFDDAYSDLYREFLPEVIEHRHTAIVFVVVKCIGKSNLWDQQSGMRARNLLTLDQIREMQRFGVEFGSHSLTHPRLTGLENAQLRCEVADSKRRLEDLLGAEVLSFAYPYGAVDAGVRYAVAEAGYRLAFTADPGVNRANDPLLQRRAEVNDSTGVADFLFKLRYGASARVAFGAFRRRFGRRETGRGI